MLVLSVNDLCAILEALVQCYFQIEPNSLGELVQNKIIESSVIILGLTLDINHGLVLLY